MNALLLLLEIIILQASIANMTNFYVSRSFYDLLSFSLVLSIFLFAYMTNKKPVVLFWGKIEAYFFNIITIYWRKIIIIVVLAAIVTALIIPVMKFTWSTPIRCHGADMLPLIRDAGSSLLAMESPFEKKYCPWNIPLTYLPAQVGAFLPALLLGLDLRILSFCYFALFLLVVVYYLNSVEKNISAFAILLIFMTSWMLQFFLSFVQIFPYILLLSLLFAATMKRRLSLAAFFSGILLVFRQTFWFLFPLFIILYLKEKDKQPLPNLLSFSAGILLGSLPFIFFLPDFFINLGSVAGHFASQNQANLFLKNSMGFSWYFTESRMILTLIQLSLFLMLYVIALKYLRVYNLWLFFSLGYLIHLFTISYARFSEYYALPILVAAIFMVDGNIKSRNKSVFPLRIAAIVLLLTLIICFFSLGPVSGIPSALSNDNFWSEMQEYQGYKGPGILEIIWQIGFLQKLNLTSPLMVIVESDEFANKDKEYVIAVSINEKEVKKSLVAGRLHRFDLSVNDLRSELVIGSNLIEFKVDPPAPFRLKTTIWR